MWPVGHGAGSEVRQGGGFWPNVCWESTLGQEEAGLPLGVSDVKIGKSDLGWAEEEDVSRCDVKGHSRVRAQSGIRVTVWGQGSQSGVG